MNRAQTALDSVQARPDDAVALARDLLADDTATDEERAMASWALGRAYSELDRIDSANTSLEDGLAIATAADLTELAAEIRVSLSVCRLTAGDTASARALLAEARAGLVATGSKGRLVMQEGLIDLHLGDFDSALGRFETAAELLTSGVDDHARARLLVNRGIIHTMSGDLVLAEADFAEARELAVVSGQEMVAAGSAQNLGFVAGRRGDVPAALTWFNRARTGYEAVGSPQRVMATLEADLCSVLLSGGLYAEAAEAAERAVAMATRGGNRLNEAEARLLLARVGLAAGAHRAAEYDALAAAEAFRRSEREPWAAMADYVGLQAAAGAAAEPDEKLLARATEITEKLLANGWLRDSLEVRTFAGRTALALGRREEARAMLTTAAEARETGSSGARASAWLAAATLRLADEDRAGARRDLATGMAIIEEHRSSLGSTELRAHASINGAEVAELGLRLATEDGDAVEVLRWAERWHAGGLRIAPVTPQPGSRLAEALIELRQAHAAAIEGTADPFADEDDDRIAALEREIRDLSRTTGADDGDGDLPDDLGLESLRERLVAEGPTPTTLVEYFTIGPELHAVLITADRVTTTALGPIETIEADITKLVAALGRLAFAAGSPGRSPTAGTRGPDPDRGTAESGDEPRTGRSAMTRATAAALTATADRLAERLVGPLDLAEQGDLVIVPTGPLQSLPWPALPTLTDRAVTVAPSATLWASGAPSPAPSAAAGDGGGVLLVCGANLPGGLAEIERLRELYRDATVLIGADATVAAVLAAMERADVVHVAAHGTFRADNPMFSALDLHDGPLTVYDVESLSRAPTTVVLPACDAARSSVRHGDELLGTASALLQVGVRTVIAPVTVVPDTAVVPALMVELHQNLRQGVAPATALVNARRALAAGQGADERDDRGSTTSAFVTIGSHRPADPDGGNGVSSTRNPAEEPDGHERSDESPGHQDGPV